MFAKAAKSLLPRAKLHQQYGAVGAIRHLNVHEYISMEIMKHHGITTPECYVASTPDEAAHIFNNSFGKGEGRRRRLGRVLCRVSHAHVFDPRFSVHAIAGTSEKDVVIKAQVLSGGRGLGTFKNGYKGGVHMITKSEQARDIAQQMLGQELVTKQAPNGILCNKVLLMERMYMRREMYLSILMDRASQGPLLVGSPVGGTSIEDVAKSRPEVIFTQPIDIIDGLQDEHCQRMASNLGLEQGSPAHAKAVTLMHNLYAMFIACDCTQVEVNPLAETPEGDVVVCDAKVNFDDNAEYRQSTIFARRDATQEDAREVEASKYDLNYIGLDGNIGCMVNGAGLAMSTMDIIQLKGGSPANFLDVGGGASEQQVQKAFEILNADPRVNAILVNIFGGIMRCDVIATGIINAAKDIGIRKPIVIRLQGTNVKEAKILIESSGFRMILADDLEDAAEKAVGVAEIVTQAEKIQVGVKFSGFQL
jgi:succinyl-CoA synthetase beta subunit